MISKCDLCRTLINDNMTSIEIDGAFFNACHKCVKLGNPINSQNPTPNNIQKSNKTKIINKNSNFDLNESDFEIAEDFFTLMRKAREQRNLSQEELGLKINEKSSVIRTLESGKLKPTVTLAKKIERFLKIKILITPEK